MPVEKREGEEPGEASRVSRATVVGGMLVGSSLPAAERGLSAF